MGIIMLLIVGLLAGALARFLVPGRDPMGLLGTMLLGIVGSFLGGTLWGLLTGEGLNLQRTDTFFGAVVGSVIALLIYRSVVSRQRV